MLGYWPNLRNPCTFNEKIRHRCLYAQPKDADILSSKRASRDYVKNIVGEGILNKVYYIGDNVDDMLKSNLPEKYILKFTHNSGGTLITNNKNKHSHDYIRQHCRKHLTQVFSDANGEPWYARIKPEIIVEELLEDPVYIVPPDYKFFMFHGKCHFIELDFGRFEDHKRCILTTEWEPMHCQKGRFDMVTPLAKPKKLDEMLQIAERLSAKIDFVRVDLFFVNDSDIRFGELTLSPAAGKAAFRPREYDAKFGALWIMSKS